jgi:hypothetical protein
MPAVTGGVVAPSEFQFRPKSPRPRCVNPFNGGSRKQLPVQRAVSDGFENVVRADVRRTREIGKGAGGLTEIVAPVDAGGNATLATIPWRSSGRRGVNTAR